MAITEAILDFWAVFDLQVIPNASYQVSSQLAFSSREEAKNRFSSNLDFR